MSLTLVFADLFAPSEPVATQAQAGLPILPALDGLLRHAHLARTEGWREWLGGVVRDVRRDTVDPPNASHADLAGTVARALVPDVAATAGFWLATPVHYVAGLDSVRLHPQGLIELNQSEQQELVHAFAGVFSADGLHLHPTAGRELLLQVPIDWPVPPSADPARFLGREPGAGLPPAGVGSPLRRLGVELEMWLHRLRLNERRTASGRLSVTGLWLWGGSGPSAAPRGAPASTRLPELSSGDVFARALWYDAAGPLRALPADFADWRAGRDPERDAIVVVPTLGEDIQPDLGRLDAQWCAPLTVALRAGELSAVSVVAGGCVATSTPRSHWRFWRRERPWWRYFS